MSRDAGPRVAHVSLVFGRRHNQVRPLDRDVNVTPHRIGRFLLCADQLDGERAILHRLLQDVLGLGLVSRELQTTNGLLDIVTAMVVIGERLILLSDPLRISLFSCMVSGESSSRTLSARRSASRNGR